MTTLLALLRRLERPLARCLEEGTFSIPPTRALSRIYARFAERSLSRPLWIPRGPSGVPSIITVGGATLGGSGKTRVALACARELASLGANVVLVGHRYRAVSSPPRFVTPADALVDVGDEALHCARSLSDVRAARVVVANSRQAAVDWALSRAPTVDVVVIDGALQTTPTRATLSLLAVDALSPWGEGHVPPAGDLRAPKRALLATADAVVPVNALPNFVIVDGQALDLRSFVRSPRFASLGLFSALARPKRLVSALLQAGLTPDVRLEAPDHGPLTRAMRSRIRAARVDLWLATPKCALHLEPLGVEVGVLDGPVQLSEELRTRLRASWDNAVHNPP